MRPWAKLNKRLKQLAKGSLRTWWTLARLQRGGGLAPLAGTDADVTLWVVPFPLPLTPFYLTTDTFIKDVASVVAMQRLGLRVRVVVGTDISTIQNTTVLLGYGKHYNVFRAHNHVAVIRHLHELLRAQGNRILPPLDEMLMWENKAHMHRVFEDKKIPCPKTLLIEDKDSLRDELPLPLPFLVKDLHSAGSLGLSVIRKPGDLHALLDDERFLARNEVVLVQELVKMSRDLRVTIIGDRIPCAYWRINPDDNWRPTSTSQGSSVDYGNFPEHWREFLLDIHRRLDLCKGGYDVTWRNDDLDTEPLILEVSPSWEPNPPLDVDNLPCTYGEYKASLRYAPDFQREFVKIVGDLHEQVVVEVLRRHAADLLPVGFDERRTRQ